MEWTPEQVGYIKGQVERYLKELVTLPAHREVEQTVFHLQGKLAVLLELLDVMVAPQSAQTDASEHIEGGKPSDRRIRKLFKRG